MEVKKENSMLSPNNNTGLKRAREQDLTSHRTFQTMWGRCYLPSFSALGWRKQGHIDMLYMRIKQSQIYTCWYEHAWTQWQLWTAVFSKLFKFYCKHVSHFDNHHMMCVKKWTSCHESCWLETEKKEPWTKRANHHRCLVKWWINQNLTGSRKQPMKWWHCPSLQVWPTGWFEFDTPALYHYKTVL